jgi:ribosomal protein S27AE
VVEIIYFQDCHHRSVCGRITPHQSFRKKPGDRVFCGKCKKTNTVANSKREVA